MFAILTLLCILQSPPPKRRLTTGTSKKRTKSRSKSRSKPRSASKPHHSSLDNSRQLPSTASVGDIKPVALDDDLKDILAELDGIEQRVTQVLQNVQKEMGMCANFMLDSIMSGVTSGVDGVKSKVPNVHKLRQANRLVKTQFRALHDSDRT